MKRNHRRTDKPPVCRLGSKKAHREIYQLGGYMRYDPTPSRGEAKGRARWKRFSARSERRSGERSPKVMGPNRKNHAEYTDDE